MLVGANVYNFDNPVSLITYAPSGFDFVQAFWTEIIPFGFVKQYGQLLTILTS